MKTSDIAKEDYKFFKEAGDLGFSPERNKAVIESTIKKHDANMLRKAQEHENEIRERSDVVASYLKSKVAQDGKPIDQYISREYMAYLRGQKRIEKIHRLQSGQKVISFEEVN